MNKLKLKSLRIENFKCIKSDTFEFDDNLTILDGPNGYGKTTMFDAIELLITGTIHRFINYEHPTKSPEQIVLLNQQDKPCFLLGEFSRLDETAESTFVGFYCPAQLLSANERKPKNLYKSFQRYILEVPPEELSLDAFKENGKLAPDQDLNSVFGLNLADEDFKTQFYVQQEDTLHFLERKDSKRMKSISRLFGMEQARSEKVKIDDKVKEGRESLEVVNVNIGSLETDLEDLKKSLMAGETVPYEPIGVLFSSTITFDWDLENPPEINKNIDSYQHRLKKVSAILENPKSFEDNRKKHLNNVQIDRFLNAPRLLEDVVLTQNFSGKYVELATQHENNDLCEKGHSQWNLDAIKKQIPSLSNLEKLGQLVGFITDYTTFYQGLYDISAALTSHSQSEALAIELMDDRKRLFERYSKDQYRENTECPLCGEEYENREKLNDSIRIKERGLKDSLSQEGRRLSEKLELMESEVLKPFREHIVTYLEKSQNVSHEFLQRLKGVQADVEQQAMLTAFSNWCATSVLGCDELLNKEAIIPLNLSERITNFHDKLNAEKTVIKAEFTDYVEVFNETFGGDSAKLEQADVLLKKVREKIEYLKFSHHQAQQVSIRKKSSELNDLKTEKVKINKRVSDLTDLSGIYKSKMRSHADQLINDIRIPFFIYSGKILQNSPQGSGVFIKMDDTTGGDTPITFTQDGSDNDVVFSFSSGQLVGVVIAFTLAMHRVYGTQSKLGFILIDDPIQSMDDINMSSLVDLFRNEFPDTQLIFSTHDASVSAYMRYKFDCFRLGSKQINMQERLSKPVLE